MFNAREMRPNLTRLISGDAIDGRPVGFLGAAIGKARLCGVQRRPTERDDEASGGVSVEPMREPGTFAKASEFAEMVFNAWGAVASCGVDGNAGRFVDDRKVAVPEKDAQGVRGA